MALDDKRIPELNPVTVATSDLQFAVYQPSSDETKRISLSQFLASADSNDILWDALGSYDTDNVVLWDDKLWASLIDDNEGIVPVEGANWHEVSKSFGSSIKAWVAGAYTDPAVVVISAHNGPKQLYQLIDITRPFLSSNIATEEIAGSWEAITDLQFETIIVLDSGIINLDLKFGRNRDFTTDDGHVADFEITFSQDINGRTLSYSFIMDTVQVVTLPGAVKMADALFNPDDQTWTPDQAGEYLLEARKNGEFWKCSIKGPYLGGSL